MIRLFKKKENPIFNFKDGTPIYQVLEEDLAKVPAQKILDIQEHLNYIALIGVDKYKYKGYLSKVKELALEAIDGKASSIATIISLTDNIEMGLETHINKIQEINVMMFDTFYYLEGEDYTKSDRRYFEKKRNLLESDPITASFFFQNHKDIFTHYGNILNGAIQVAALQTALIKELKEKIYSDISKEP